MLHFRDLDSAKQLYVRPSCQSFLSSGGTQITIIWDSHNRIDLQSFKQELVKMMLFFYHLFYQNLHFSSIHLEITCQSMPKYIEEMERTSSVLCEGEKKHD